MQRVHVICGGVSAEREVSLRSGRAVAEALAAKGYRVHTLDTTDPDERIAECDVVFPVLHGVGGEDGTFQARLEALGVCFVGSGSAASRLCMDKAAFRQHMTSAGFGMADGGPHTYEAYQSSPLAGAPHVIKPVDGGSSIDTLIIRDAAARDETAIRDAFERHSHMLVERLIVGDEITVGVLGDQALPVIEIIPPSDGEFDYTNKYNGHTQELCPPAHISAAVQEAAQHLALRVHQAAGCRHLSRTDCIVDGGGQLYLLETNTIPGMTAQSLYPKMAVTAGLDFPSLCAQLVGMALDTHR